MSYNVNRVVLYQNKPKIAVGDTVQFTYDIYQNPKDMDHKNVPCHNKNQGVAKRQWDVGMKSRRWLSRTQKIINSSTGAWCQQSSLNTSKSALRAGPDSRLAQRSVTGNIQGQSVSTKKNIRSIFTVITCREQKICSQLVNNMFFLTSQIQSHLPSFGLLHTNLSCSTAYFYQELTTEKKKTSAHRSSSSKYSTSCRMFSFPWQWWNMSISFSTLWRLYFPVFSTTWQNRQTKRF